MTRRRTSLIVAAAFGLVCIVSTATAYEGCEPEPITPNTPTGIAGCRVFGEGTASMYGPGNGVAMNFCTWELRHSVGCGSVAVQSLTTGITVVVPVVDFCDCYTGTADERVVDLQYSVVAALGLDPAQGLWPVYVSAVGSGTDGEPQPPVREGESASVLAPPLKALPDTATP